MVIFDVVDATTEIDKIFGEQSMFTACVRGGYFNMIISVVRDGKTLLSQKAVELMSIKDGHPDLVYDTYKHLISDLSNVLKRHSKTIDRI